MVNTPSPKTTGPIAGIIAYCARHTGLTVIIVMLLAIWGYRSLTTTPLDAIPDLSDAQVIIYSEWPGRSPDLVEDQITYPLTSAMLAAPQVKFVRGQSFFGLSFVYVIFNEDTDIYWARSRVVEYLNSAASELPDGVRPTLGPDATGVGWVFEYALVDKSGRNDLAQLRSLQDFKLRYWLESIEGVAEVASVGGFEKEYQVTVDPDKLADYGITLKQVAKAIRRSNNDVGGRVLEIAGHEHFIRGRGYIKSVNDIERIALRADKTGTPVMLRDVAHVGIGPTMRRGLAELDGEGETVGGIVIMRYGEDALDVIERVKQRLAEVESSLPEGVEIVTTYDRSDLILNAINTLKLTLFEEMLIVSLVIAAFLLHLRSALVVIVSLPIAVLLAFIPLSAQHLTANIMSLGGIAVAIGAMVDAAIVMIDNIHKQLEQHAEQTPVRRFDIILRAMQQVGPSIFFSLLIITLAFVPVFALEGTEGRLFKPLAFTKTYAMGFAALLSITLIPALAVLLIRGNRHSGQDWINRRLVNLYQPVVRFALRFRAWVIGLSLLSLLATIPVFLQLGSEFMPPLNEGSILYMPTTLPGLSITEAGNVLQAMDRQLKTFPEVDRVFGKIGRSTSPTDPAPLSMVETVITLKPKKQWREGMTWDKLIADMDAQLQYPGMPNIWWMPIQTRTEMLATGIRSGLGIKVFGDDLTTIEQTAVRLEQLLGTDARTNPYTRSIYAERLSGGYFLDFTIDRDKIARYGLTVDDVEETLATAAGGLTVSRTFEGRERYAINLRYARDFRATPEALQRILVPTPGGAQVPIGQLADIGFETGPSMLRNEDGQLVSFLFIDVKDLGMVDYVDLARQVIAEQAELPQGVRLAWAGQFSYFESAKSKLKVLAPLALSIIAVMLFLNHGSLTATLIILLAIPFSLTGAVWLLYFLDYNLSVAVWIGLLALAGLDAEMGVLMMLYLDLSYRQRQTEHRLQTPADLDDAIITGACQRIRPMLMTSLASFIGLLPILWSSGAGADVMKRIAAPMVGGIATALIMVLLVFPAVYSYWKGWKQ